MDRSAYRLLRFSVESLIADFDRGGIDADALLNGVMRRFLQTVADTQIKQASGKRAFRTYRRDAEVVTPSWAIRKPGISTRLPSL